MLLATFTLSACTFRPPASDYPRTPSYALTDTSATPLARAYAPSEKQHPNQSGFHLLTNGSEALMTCIALVESARASIDLQYYSTKDDTTGKLLLEAILRAAARGVRVRMLLDDWSLDDFRKGAIVLDQNPNIDIRVFNPYATRDQSVLTRIGNVFSYLGPFTRRMHNKALVVDNQIAIMGGRNVGDEYFDAGKDINFRDADVLAAGPIARSISNNFDSYWNSDESYPIAALHVPSSDPAATADLRKDLDTHWQEIKHSDIGKQLSRMPMPHRVKNGGIPLIWAHSELAADTPKKIDQPEDKIVSAPEKSIKNLAAHATNEFIIFSPYFVPLNDGVEWLTDLVRRGVHVRIITNSLASTDVVPAQAGYSHYREALVKGGVEIYEYKASSLPSQHQKSMFKPSSVNGLHAKMYLVDRRDLAIGSFNLDPRSIHINTEQVLIIHSPELGAKIGKLFEDVTAPESSYRVTTDADGNLIWQCTENGKPASFDFNPHAGLLRRVTDAFFSILPIDNML